MKIGRNTSTQKTIDPYGVRNTESNQRVQRTAEIDDITGAYVTLSSFAEHKRVKAMTYSAPSAKERPEKVYNYKSDSGVSAADVANMQPGDRIVYKTKNGDINEYTYKTGDTAHNIMHAVGVSDNPYNNSYAAKNNIAKYTNAVNALKSQNNAQINTYSDDFVQVSLSTDIGLKAI